MASVSVSTTAIAGWAVRVAVTVTGAAPGDTMSVFRVVGSRETPVIAAEGVPAETTFFDDTEVDLNIATVWRVVLSTGETATSSARTVTNVWPVLSDPYRGRWVEVGIVSTGDRSVEQRGRAIDIEETSEVVYVYDVESAARSELVLATRSDADLSVFSELVAAGGPLLLRAACQEHQVGWWGRDGGTRSSRRLDETGRSAWWIHTFSSAVLVPVPQPGVRPVGDTLQDLHDVVPGTLADIASTWATLADIAAADLRSA